MTDFRDPHHLPKRRPAGALFDPNTLPRQRRGTTPQMHGRYPDYDVMAEQGAWDDATRQVVVDRVEHPPEVRYFSPGEAACLRAFCDVVMAQDAEPRIPVLEFVDEKLYEGRRDGYRYAGLPDDGELFREFAETLDAAASDRGAESFAAASPDVREAIVAQVADGRLGVGCLRRYDAKRVWSVVMRYVLAAFYAHPWAWNEIGFGGPAYPRGYMRLGIGQSEPWEGAEARHDDPGREFRR